MISRIRVGDRAAHTKIERNLMTDEEINRISLKFAELIEADRASKSPSVPTEMARISGAIREALSCQPDRAARPDLDKVTELCNAVQLVALPDTTTYKLARELLAQLEET